MSDEAPAEVPPTDPPTEDAPAAEKAPAATDEPREDEEKEETTENPVGGDAAVKVTTDGAEGDDLLAGAAEADDKKEEAAPAEEEAGVEEKFGEQNFRVLSEMRGKILYYNPIFFQKSCQNHPKCKKNAVKIWKSGSENPIPNLKSVSQNP